MPSAAAPIEPTISPLNSQEKDIMQRQQPLIKISDIKTLVELVYLVSSHWTVGKSKSHRKGVLERLLFMGKSKEGSHPELGQWSCKGQERGGGRIYKRKPSTMPD